MAAAIDISPLEKVGVKFSIEAQGPVDDTAVLETLHQWVKDQKDGELLLDVAPYNHIKNGPGTLVVGFYQNISVDKSGGQLGFQVIQKKSRFSGLQAALQSALSSALVYGQKLAREPRLQNLSINFNRFSILSNDRLLAPNTPETAEALKEAVSPLLEKVWQDGFDMAHLQDTRSRLTLEVTAQGDASVQHLADRLHSSKTTLITVGPQLDEAQGQLTFAKALQDEMGDIMKAGYPSETCGLLVVTKEGHHYMVAKVVQAKNLNTDRAVDRFTLDPDDFMKADLAAQKEGQEILGIWHAHPDHPPVPSKSDLDAAFEGYAYVIATITQDGLGEVKSYRLNENLFSEENINA